MATAKHRMEKLLEGRRTVPSHRYTSYGGIFSCPLGTYGPHRGPSSVHSPFYLLDFVDSLRAMYYRSYRSLKLLLLLPSPPELQERRIIVTITIIRV